MSLWRGNHGQKNVWKEKKKSQARLGSRNSSGYRVSRPTRQVISEFLEMGLVLEGVSHEHAIVSLGSFEIGWPRLRFSICDRYSIDAALFFRVPTYLHNPRRYFFSAPRSLSSSEIPRCYSVDASPDPIPKPTYADLRVEKKKKTNRQITPKKSRIRYTRVS